jgi:hypothetical protein
VLLRRQQPAPPSIHFFVITLLIVRLEEMRHAQIGCGLLELQLKHQVLARPQLLANEELNIINL